MPVLPALVHLPDEQEIVAATAFPQTTRRATSQKGTNQHLLRSTAHENSSWRLFSAEPLRFLQRVFSCSSLFRTSLAVVSPGCSAWHIATAISFHRNQPSRGSCLHTCLQYRAFLPCFPWTTQVVRALLASSESWAEQPVAARLHPGSLLLTSVRFPRSAANDPEVLPWPSVWTAKRGRIAGVTV